LQQEGVGELDVPVVGALVGRSFVFLDMGISILFLVFPFFFFWVLCLIYGGQGFIIILFLVFPFFFWVLCLIYGGQGFIIEKSPLKG
jgi:hypothetical protein